MKYELELSFLLFITAFYLHYKPQFKEVAVSLTRLNHNPQAAKHITALLLLIFITNLLIVLALYYDVSRLGDALNTHINQSNSISSFPFQFKR